MSKHWPTFLTMSYSLLSSYLLASYSNKHGYRYGKESLMYRLSLANGGLGGLFFSKYFEKNYPVTFAYTILGFVIAGSYHQFNNFIKESQLQSIKKSKTV